MSKPNQPATMGCEYQPLVCLQSGDIYAYEALARFYTSDGCPVAPNRVFEDLHICPVALAETEFAAKLLQLRLAPPGYPLFINLDPHSLSPSLMGKLVPVLGQHRELVVELIENTCISDALAAMALQQQLMDLGISVALDDIGAPHAILSLELLSRVDWLKFDRHWLSRLDCPGDCRLLGSLIDYAAAVGKKTVIEGIETLAQFEAVKAMGFSLAQGFLFTDKFIKPAEKSPLSSEVLTALERIKSGSSAQNCA